MAWYGMVCMYVCMYVIYMAAWCHCVAMFLGLDELPSDLNMAIKVFFVMTQQDRI